MATNSASHCGNPVRAEHQMGEQGTETSAHDLHQHVSKCLAPVQVTSDRHHQADRRIEVSTGDWRKAVPRASAIKRRAMSNCSMIPPGDLSA